jgi:hypothetical protein
MNEFSDERKQSTEIDLFQKTCGGIVDPTLIILKVHLLTEYYLERLIHICLKRGDRVIKDGRLSYQQKLVLVDSLDILDDNIIQSLKELNKIRNSCAHKINKEITMADVELIARPLGKQCTKFRVKAKNNSLIFLHSILAFICGLVSWLHIVNN